MIKARSGSTKINSSLAVCPAPNNMGLAVTPPLSSNFASVSNLTSGGRNGPKP